MQPVVQPAVQPVRQPVVLSCKRGCRTMGVSYLTLL